ncbi:MAG: hypothetical protein PVJ43_03330 [Gemmatimonadales bacterium]|jgi:hypothetical protein
MDNVTKGRQLSVTIAVIAAVIAGLVMAVVWRTGGALDTAVDFLGRWFFAVFCTVYALTQLRVYILRRKQEARVAAGVPPSAFGYFTVLWFVLAAAAVVYGIRGGGGWWETAAWVTIVAVICIQLFVLGRLIHRANPR